ncbi:MAG: TonB-dependent receptor, partial [bacterium]|nr:TonB-dependent receptor [bacterium]
MNNYLISGSRYLVIILLIIYMPFWPHLEAIKKKELDKYFKMSIKELLEVDVYIASKSRQKIDDAPGVVTVITSEEIKNMGARDLRDVLRTVPGFELGMRNTSYTGIGVRGVMTLNSEKVKILIDEVPVNENLEGSGTVMFGELPVDNIERIEILRGPGSALYGDSAFVAVINILTKKADIDNTSVSVKGGSFNTKEVGFLLGKKSANFKIKASFNYHDTDGGKIAIDSDILTNDPLNRDISLPAAGRGYAIEGRKKIISSLNLSYKNLYFKGFYVNLEKNHYLGGLGAVVDGSLLKSYQLNGMLGYKFSPNERLEIEPRIYTLLYKLENLWQNYPAGYRSPFGLVYPHGLYQLANVTQKKFGCDVKFTFNLSGNNQFIAGTSFESIRFTNDGDFNNVANPELDSDNLEPAPSILDADPRKIFAVFFQDQWDVSNRVTLTAGLRYDKYNDAGSTVNPRLAVVLKPFDKTVFKLMYGRAFRAPIFVELYLNYAGGFVTGNEGNKPETINTGELEFSYSFTETIHFRANFFYNSINNLI